MKQKPIARLLLSLVSVSAFARSEYDDQTSQPTVEQAAKHDATAEAPKSMHSHEAVEMQENASTKTPANSPAAEPNKSSTLVTMAVKVSGDYQKLYQPG
jgi:hypothetical protein